MQAKIIAYIRLGSYIEVAAAACGISKQVFFHWLHEGGKPKRERDEAQAKGEEYVIPARVQIYVDFLDAVEQAQAEADLLDLSEIRKATPTNWQAAAWRLERRHPKQWGRQDVLRAEHSGPDGGPIITGNADDEAKKATINAAYKAKMKREVMIELGLIPRD